MKLNYDKCINLTTNQRTSSMNFKDESTVPRRNRAVYLGSFLTDTTENAAEVSNRIAMAMKTAKQLKICWDKANTNTEWNLKVFNAVIQSKIPYGFATMQLTQRELNKLDAFQTRNLRRILKHPPTCVDRTQTNEQVRDKVLEYGLKMEKVSITWKQAKIKLLRHKIFSSY